MASLDSQRDLFDVPDEIAYLNTTNMSPLLRSVRQAGARALAWSATRRSNHSHTDSSTSATALAGRSGRAAPPSAPNTPRDRSR
jgi:hypothetical protein